RKNIRKLAIYGLLFGALGDISAILIFGHLLKLGGYLNYGPLGFFNIPFFPPIAWTIWFILYFYFLPDRKILKYIYITTAALYATIFSNVLANLNIFKWNYSKIILPFFIYITWFIGSTWAKERLDHNN
ncbi:MAG: hypothetical protein ACQEP9_09855, partial [Bacillota bacterium]